MTTSFDRVPNRRNPQVRNKWTTYPCDVIPMWVADMDFRSPQPVLRELRKALDHGVLGYELPSDPLLKTVAARMDRLYGWKIAPEMVIPVTGIVSGFNVAARTFCEEQKGYLVQPPVYGEFLMLKDSVGLRQYDAPLKQTVNDKILHYEINWGALEKQISKVRLFLLCHPHNPIGLIYSRSDLRRMAEMCLEHDVIIVSDEIHSELLLDGQKFTPLAKLSKAIANRTITLVAPSKTFNVPGLFCGFAIIPDPQLRAEYALMVEKLRLHVSSLGLRAALVALSGECDAWLADLRSYLTGNRDFLINYIAQYLPDIRVTQPDATYLAWLDCSELVRQGRIVGSPFDFFLNEAKVAFSDGKVFGAASGEFVRLNFGCTRRTLKQALDRVRDSLYRRKNG